MIVVKQLLRLVPILLVLSHLIAQSTGHGSSGHHADEAIGYAPIGVMGDHLQHKGEWMISARFFEMRMKDNIFNGEEISDSEILEFSNPLSNMPMNLSVIPQEMTMRMLMLGTMYAPTDDLTLMGMTMFNMKNMQLNTHRGMMGREYLGSFETSTSGISSLSLTGLYRLHERENNRLHLHLGLDKGLGSNDSVSDVLNPMNKRMSMTVPYGMQVSSQSLRSILGVTNVSTFAEYVFGNQVLLNKAISKENWAYGVKWELNTWLQKPINDSLSLSARMQYINQNSLEGNDSRIQLPVQTANPQNYGGEIINLGLGINTVMNVLGGKSGDRLSFELIFPLHQNKHGLQMENKFMVTLGFQKSL